VFTSDVTPHVRRFCAAVLTGLGVTTTSLPADASPAQLETLFSDRVSGEGGAPRIKAILVQGLAPPRMHLPDLAEISRVAQSHDAIVIYDNTWTCGWAYDAIANGADVVISSGAGVLSPDGAPDGLGLVTSTERLFREVETYRAHIHTLHSRTHARTRTRARAHTHTHTKLLLQGPGKEGGEEALALLSRTHELACPRTDGSVT
jgi:cystathionine beta-lyase/cystathionine gamma-synthase